MSEQSGAPASPVAEIDVFEGAKRLAAGETLFVDIRDPVSYETCHIPGAVRLDNSNVERFVSRTDKGRDVVVYCYHGISSISGGAFLRQHGFKRVSSLRGGFEAWQRAGAATSLDEPSVGEALIAGIGALRPGDVEDLAALGRYYHPDVVFEDPMQRIIGRDGFLAMNRRALEVAVEYRIDFEDRLETDTMLFSNWRMTYRPRRGPRLRIVGATRLRLEGGLVVEHRDYWDLLSSLVSSAPRLERAYGWLMKKIA